jgi:hypothetical protein
LSTALNLHDYQALSRLHWASIRRLRPAYQQGDELDTRRLVILLLVHRRMDFGPKSGQTPGDLCFT